jgi:hypothetical protein
MALGSRPSPYLPVHGRHAWPFREEQRSSHFAVISQLRYIHCSNNEISRKDRYKTDITYLEPSIISYR